MLKTVPRVIICGLSLGVIGGFTCRLINDKNIIKTRDPLFRIKP